MGAFSSPFFSGRNLLLPRRPPVKTGRRQNECHTLTRTEFSKRSIAFASRLTSRAIPMVVWK